MRGLGFEVTSNEYSAYMNVAYRYIASLTMKNAEEFSPFVDGWSHQPTTKELFRSVSYPDLLPPLDGILHVEGDFTTAFHHTAKFDVVITLFFIDTATNLLKYFYTIRDVLKAGGIWINLGPLLYGTRAMVELSLDEIIDVVEAIGFEFLETDERWGNLTLPGKMVRGKEARYGLSPRVLTKNSYMAQFWVVRRE